MPSREKIEQKADYRERQYEENSLMLNKNQEDYQVTDAVFDKPTLEGLNRLINRRIIDTIKGAVKAGKEAHIYWAVDPNGQELAIKIYYTSTSDFRRGMIKYIEGDPRFKHYRNDPRSIIYTWTQKEFSNLQLAVQAGVNSPKPRDFYRNILVMQFIGTDGVPAPLLKELPLKDPIEFYDKLTNDMQLLYQSAGLVHGDLSEYNIMVWDEKPVIFDLSQAMLKSHPIADELLRHDVETINSYFHRLGVEVYDNNALMEWVKSGEKELR